MDYAKLQNGSDIRGVAMEGIAGQEVNLTQDVVENVGRAFFEWLRARKEGKNSIRIAIGRDSRLSGETLTNWFAQAAARCGADVTDFSLATTPAMFMSTVTDGYEFDGAVMVTASHLPYNRNGFKFFTRDGGLEKEDIREILQIASGGSFNSENNRGTVRQGDFMSVYSKQLVDKIRQGVKAENYSQPLNGFNIVVDAGNGAGGFFVKDVLEPLGANTSGSVYLTPDGHFPNHAPNPEDKTAMESITAVTLQNHADMGIIFDTDVDRAGAVLSDGRELNRNRLIAILSAILLRDHKGTAIVTDSITSTGLAAFITKHGGIHRRFKRGYRNVINESIRLNESGVSSEMAIETSGHGALRENHFLDDGAYLMVKLLIELAKSKNEGYELESLISDLAEPVESREFRMKLLCEDFAQYGNRVIAQVTEKVSAIDGFTPADENFEGIRVALDEKNGNGWFLLRMSLHDPLMPLNIESDEVGGVKKIAEKIYALLDEFNELDTSELRKFME